MSRRRIARTSDLASGSMQRFDVDGHAICLANVGECVFRAVEDRCTHEDEPLSDGYLEGLEVECPAHGSRFSLVTGEVSGLPATEPVAIINVSVEDGFVYVDI